MIDEVFDLFVSLNATDEQLDFPILYASGRDGWRTSSLDNKNNLHEMLDIIIDHVESPNTDIDKP